MLAFDASIKIYLSLEPMDMRKAINGLSISVLEDLQRNPQDQALYIFHNRARNKIKCLLWDRNGFVLIYKRLERGRFQFSSALQDGVYALSHQQLAWLFAGFDFIKMSQFPELKFDNYD